jgi:acetate kinase
LDVALLSRVLVVNAGSTSCKLSLVDGAEQEEPVASMDDLPDDVVAVGHRVVHGGAQFSQPVVLDDDVERRLAALAELAPLHNRPAISGIEAARAALPDRPQVAVFDTAFHVTLPPEASTYALPTRLREAMGIRRYGFHGLSVQWAAERVPVPRLVVCHLGGGCSVTAVQAGRSIDTTMGFTPLEGVPMATRAGSVDAGALLYLLRRGMDVDELERTLEFESGLRGLSGDSGSVRELEASVRPEAAAALAHFAYHVATAVGAMAVALRGLDALVFTAGVGERSWRVREAVCERLGHLGVTLDVERNRAARPDCELATPSSPTRVIVLHTRENLVVARAVRAALRPRGEI